MLAGNRPGKRKLGVVPTTPASEGTLGAEFLDPTSEDAACFSTHLG
jgi:hypothetical protein